jgi:NAD(P)H-dependent FMN reductase
MRDEKKVLIFYGSVRDTREGIKAAKFIEKQLKQKKHDAKLIDPKEYDLPMLNKMYKEYKNDAPQKMDELGKLINDADGFIVVSGEYNHGVPPALKNMLDHYQKEYFFKPCAIATYSAGPFGGVRVGKDLRGILGELGMITTSTMFPISQVQDAFTEEGDDTSPNNVYSKRIQKFLDEFEWYLDALKEKRKKGTPY